MARPEAYSEFIPASDIELFTKVVNCFRPLTTFAESTFLGVGQGSGYAGFMVHLRCGRASGFVSLNKLPQKVNKL